MKVNGISLGWVVVKSLEDAIKFYTETVGLEMSQHTPEYGWAEFKGDDGAILGVAQENDQLDFKAGNNAVMCISVADMDVAIKHYMEKGANLVGEVIEVPGHVKMQTFIDKDGNAFQLVCEMPSIV
jgi:predicted enzyme related to lactoylglutathione lyase